MLSALAAATSEPAAFPASAQYAERKKKNAKGSAKGKKANKNQEYEYDEESREEEEEAEDEREARVCPVDSEPVKDTAELQVAGNEGTPAKPQGCKRPPIEEAGEASGRPAKKAASYGAYSPGDYCCSRDKFIQAARSRLNVSFRQANQMWMGCDARRNLLKDVPLRELKRRRFVDKSCSVHPFAD